MTLTQEAKKHLLNICNDMQKAESFLLKETTIIGVKSNLSHAPEHTYINKANGEQMGIFEKRMGNDLCYLNNAIRSLKYFLTNNQ